MMKRLLLAVLGGVLVTVGLAVPTAHAADNQKVCNSQYSHRDFDVHVNVSNANFTMYAGRCENLPRGGYTLYLTNAGYRVGYNYGDYSECRYNSQPFTPYQKANIIYFRVYDRYDCTNY